MEIVEQLRGGGGLGTYDNWRAISKSLQGTDTYGLIDEEGVNL